MRGEIYTIRVEEHETTSRKTSHTKQNIITQKQQDYISSMYRDKILRKILMMTQYVTEYVLDYKRYYI